jgi:uncharacterized metal-binding protein YceD (DUF177 family)
VTDRFAHQLRLDHIRDGERLDLIADEAERQAIAERLGLKGLSCLEAHAVMARNGEIVRVHGRLAAALEQSCVVTSEPVAAHVDEPFNLIFTPEPQVSAAEDEIALDETDCDVVFHDGAVIDLGGAIADSLALSLDPYPRTAGAEAALREAGVLNETEASPFAALAKLKRNDEASG